MKKLLLSLFLSLFFTLPTQAATLLDIECGAVTVAAGSASNTASVTISDTAKAFLVFSARSSSARPDDGMFRGEVTNGTTLTFTRGRSTSSPEANIEYCVVEFSSGVTVQRGTVLVDIDPEDVTITAIDTAKTFPITSASSVSTGYNSGQFAQVSLTSTTNLRINPVTESDNMTVAWQVIEWDTASVQNGTVALSAVETSNTATVSSVTTTKSFLFYTWDMAGATSSAGYCPRCVLTNATTVTCDRGVADVLAMNVNFFLVSTTDNISVQRGSTQFDTASTSEDATITAVDTARAFPTSGDMYGCTNNQNIAGNSSSASRAVYDITTTTNLNLKRDGVGAGVTADAGWQVIEFLAVTGRRRLL